MALSGVEAAAQAREHELESEVRNYHLLQLHHDRRYFIMW